MYTKFDRSREGQRSKRVPAAAVRSLDPPEDLDRICRIRIQISKASRTAKILVRLSFGENCELDAKKDDSFE